VRRRATLVLLTATSLAFATSCDDDQSLPAEREVASTIETSGTDAEASASTSVAVASAPTSTARRAEAVDSTESTTTTTTPEADPRGRRFGYTGQIGVFPMSGDLCFPSAGSVTITTPPDATVDLAEVTGDPTAPSGDVPVEIEVTFTPELPTSGAMAYAISAGGAFFRGAGTFTIEWSNFGELIGTMRLRDSAATAQAGPFIVDDSQELAGIFEVTEVGTC
jgi:lipoprotein-anchoring transpeptidase ErfK/SrfK